MSTDTAFFSAALVGLTVAAVIRPHVRHGWALSVNALLVGFVAGFVSLFGGQVVQGCTLIAAALLLEMWGNARQNMAAGRQWRENR